ncbi:hypothetical protein FRC98_08230 [Lujinxingia vulgaris]|uniref:C2H2-type domain-containing protein n=1 Tax=Lujinxingia vulgaris TaxID=2600176 RepID=A0A5C6XFM2_9DELT|nr:hypothetical protein [Lujinxingia vulgaris]TXD37667.1 hypothetical protein FRC98_08230 [Lujinxingia vulgaris]
MLSQACVTGLWGPLLGGRLPLLAAILTVCAAVLCVPLSAHAQHEDASLDRMIERLGEQDVQAGSGELAPSTVAPLNLEVQWRLWRTLIESGEPGINELQALRDDALSLGRVSLPEHALAVLAVARARDHYGLSTADTEALLTMAMTMAPELPYPALELARQRLKDQGAPHRAIAPFVEGVRRGVQSPDICMAWVLKFSIFFLLSVLVSFGAFMLSQLLRYFGVAAYDGTRWLPRGFSSNQTVILLVALVIVPGLLLRSPLASVLIMLAMVIPFQQINERVVSAFFLAVILALPSIDVALSRMVLFPGSPAQTLAHEHLRGCDSGCLERAKAHLGEDATPTQRYAAAVALFRTGTPEAMARVVDLSDDPQNQATRLLEAQWANLKGAALIAQARPDEALEPLERAELMLPEAPEPHFNRMRALQLSGDEEGGYDALDQAVRHGLASVGRYLDTGRRDANSLLMLIPLQSSQIWQEHLAYTETITTISMISPFWQALAGPQLPLSLAPYVGGAGLLWLLMTLQIYLRQRVSTPCPKCGLARDPDDARDLGGHHYCLPCYQTFVSGATLDYHARIHSETTLGRRDRFQSFLRRTLSLLLPGMGHALGGHALRGTLAFFALAFGAFWLMNPMGLWRVPTELFHEGWAGQQAIAIVLMALGALVGLWGLVAGVEPTRVRGARGQSEAKR